MIKYDSLLTRKFFIRFDQTMRSFAILSYTENLKKEEEKNGNRGCGMMKMWNYIKRVSSTCGHCKGIKCEAGEGENPKLFPLLQNHEVRNLERIGI